MTLRRKATLLGIAQLLLLATAIWVAASVAASVYVRGTEHADAVESIGRIQRVLDSRAKDMTRLAADWGFRNRTHDFVAGRGPDYLEQNLAPGTVDALGLSAMVFYDRDGRLVHAQGPDVDGRRGAASPALLDSLARNPSLLRHTETTSVRAGMLAGEGVHVMLASVPILRNDRKGPVGGTLVVAATVQGDLAQRVAIVSGVPFAMESVPADSARAARLASSSEGHEPAGGHADVATAVDVQTIGGDRYMATAFLRDIFGNPTCRVRLTRPRLDHLRARAAANQTAIAILVLGLAGGGVAMVAGDRLLYSRLSRLTESVKAIGESGDAGARVNVQGDRADEISGLAAAMNDTLDALHAAKLSHEQSAELFARVIDRASDCVVVADAVSLGLLQANRTFVAKLGMSQADLEGLTLNDVLAGVPQPMRERLLEPADGSRPSLAEGPCRLPDGKEVEMELAVDRMRLGDRDVILLVGRDITGRKQVERMKADFTSMISHELRSPLTTIMGWSVLLADDLSAEDSEVRRRAVEQISRKSQEMRRLVDDLLSVRAIQAAGLSLALEPTPVAGLVAESVDGLELSPDHQLTVEVDDDLPEVVCDRERLIYVLHNLLRNAAKFSPEGGPLMVRAYADGDRLTLTVEDHGVGIPTEDLPVVFDRFVQADMSSTRRFGGFGLGLYVVKSIVDAHGGDVRVQSEVGHGSRFTVRLPFAGPAVQGAGRAGRPPDPTA